MMNLSTVVSPAKQDGKGVSERLRFLLLLRYPSGPSGQAKTGSVCSVSTPGKQIGGFRERAHYNTIYPLRDAVIVLTASP
jgi:hypothetical protein